MADPEIVRKGDRTEIGTTVRVESGPPMHRRRATEEALSNDVTADHYQVGNRDAMGELIAEGAMFHYLDWLGPRVFYVFKQRQIDESDPRFAVGEPDPNAPPLNEDTTNVRQYRYVFDQVAISPTEDEAIEAGIAFEKGEPWPS